MKPLKGTYLFSRRGLSPPEDCRGLQAVSRKRQRPKYSSTAYSKAEEDTALNESRLATHVLRVQQTDTSSAKYRFVKPATFSLFPNGSGLGISLSNYCSAILYTLDLANRFKKDSAKTSAADAGTASPLGTSSHSTPVQPNLDRLSRRVNRTAQARIFCAVTYRPTNGITIW